MKILGKTVLKIRLRKKYFLRKSMLYFKTNVIKICKKVLVIKMK